MELELLRMSRPTRARGLKRFIALRSEYQGAGRAPRGRVD